MLTALIIGCTREPARKGVSSAEAEYIRTEVEYFKTALRGKYSQKDITIHYKLLRVSDYLDYYFESMLRYAEPFNINKSSDSDKTKNNTTLIPIDPDSLSSIIDALKENQASNEGYTSNVKPAFKGNNVNQLYYRLVDLRNVMLSEDDQTHPEKLMELVTTGSERVAASVYKNKNAPQVARYIYTIRTTFETDNPDKNAVIPGFKLKYEKKAWKQLSNDKHEEVRMWVAKHKLTPKQVVSNLASDSSEQIRRTVAQRFDLSTEILSKLSQDKDDTVRIAVAMNPNTPSEILDRLSLDNNESIKVAVAMNRNTPVTVLKSRLLSSNVASISKAAEENLQKRSPNQGRQTDCITLRSIPPLRP